MTAPTPTTPTLTRATTDELLYIVQWTGAAHGIAPTNVRHERTSLSFTLQSVAPVSAGRRPTT